MNLKPLISAVLLFFSGVFAGLLVLTVEPNLWVKVGELVSEDHGHVKAEELGFSEDQIDDLNKLYDERREEYGYCLEPQENSSVDLRHPTSVNRSNSSYVRYSCPVSYSGRLHTHPNADSVAELSTLDKESLANQTIEFSCILTGPVPGDVERDPVSLQCYKDPYPDREFESERELNETVKEADFQNIPVRIE